MFFCVFRRRQNTRHKLVPDKKKILRQKTPHFVLNVTALKIPLKIIYALLRLHTFWYCKLVFLILLKRRKWNIMKYQTTCFLLTVICLAICYYLVRML